MGKLVSDPQPKTEYVGCRVTERQKDAVERLAHDDGLSVSHLLRFNSLRELLERAETELEVEL